MKDSFHARQEHECSTCLPGQCAGQQWPDTGSHSDCRLQHRLSLQISSPTQCTHAQIALRRELHVQALLLETAQFYAQSSSVHVGWQGGIADEGSMLAVTLPAHRRSGAE